MQPRKNLGLYLIRPHNIPENSKSLTRARTSGWSSMYINCTASRYTVWHTQWRITRMYTYIVYVHSFYVADITDSFNWWYMSFNCQNYRDRKQRLLICLKHLSMNLVSSDFIAGQQYLWITSVTLRFYFFVCLPTIASSFESIDQLHLELNEEVLVLLDDRIK